MIKSVPWDWAKNESNIWRIPIVESAYLGERWIQKGFKKLLDLGCGLGRHSIYFAKNDFQVSSMDLSEYGVNHLNKWAKEEGVTINSCIGDMLSLPYEENSFDCIMAYNVIYHTNTEGFIKTLEEIKRVLKPNGELYMTLISKNTWSWHQKEKYIQIDNNTILRDEHETEKNVPHFYVNIDDIVQYFKEFNFVLLPKECTEYDLENTKYYSSHFEMLLVKK